MRTRKEQVSIEYLREALDYNPETGVLTWKVRPLRHFKDKRATASINTRLAGKPAFTAVQSAGYLCGNIEKRQYLAHRVIWAWYHGEWPPEDMVIDHVNMDKTDNRIINLELVTLVENIRRYHASKAA